MLALVLVGLGSDVALQEPDEEAVSRRRDGHLSITDELLSCLSEELTFACLSRR
jgi:hypothetical protein